MVKHILVKDENGEVRLSEKEGKYTFIKEVLGDTPSKTKISITEQGLIVLRETLNEIFRSPQIDNPLPQDDKLMVLTTLPSDAIVTIGELAKYLRMNPQKMVDALPDDLRITKIGTLETSIIKTQDLFIKSVQGGLTAKNLKSPRPITSAISNNTVEIVVETPAQIT